MTREEMDSEEISTEDVENLVVEGVAFTFSRNCANADFLTDSDFYKLKTIIRGYLQIGPDYDKKFKDWYLAKNWTT